MFHILHTMLWYLKGEILPPNALFILFWACCSPELQLKSHSEKLHIDMLFDVGAWK